MTCLNTAEVFWISSECKLEEYRELNERIGERYRASCLILRASRVMDHRLDVLSDPASTLRTPAVVDTSEITYVR